MRTFFYSNISEFAGNLGGTIDEVTYKKTVHNMHRLGWKAQYLNSTDISMLGYGCGASQYPQFYDKIKTITKCSHVHMWESIQVKRVVNFCTNHGFLH